MYSNISFNKSSNFSEAKCAKCANSQFDSYFKKYHKSNLLILFINIKYNYRRLSSQCEQ